MHVGKIKCKKSSGKKGTRVFQPLGCLVHLVPFKFAQKAACRVQAAVPCGHPFRSWRLAGTSVAAVG